MDETAKILLEEVLAAHGGIALWKEISWIEADISADGFLFKAKHIRPLRGLRMRASAKTPRFQLLDFPGPGLTSELNGGMEVRILDQAGSVVDRRLSPRKAFDGPRRNFWWDVLDFIYFAGYATWNYLLTPFLFLREGFSFEILGERPGKGGPFICLRATFPEDIPTHSRTQTFWFDEGRLLRRLDYTAEVVGPWAHAAHFCDEYRNFSGIQFPTCRRVLPKFLGRVMAGPVLVAIDVQDVKLIREG